MQEHRGTAFFGRVSSFGLSVLSIVFLAMIVISLPACSRNNPAPSDNPATRAAPGSDRAARPESPQPAPDSLRQSSDSRMTDSSPGRQDSRPPASHYIDGLTQVYQTLNNCSAASVSIALSRWGIDRSQHELRPRIRPDERAKRGPPERIVKLLREEELHADIYHGGSVELLHELVSAGIPVIVQQLVNANEQPIGHYRVVRGYDRRSDELYAADPLRGEDIRLTSEEFYKLWHPFSNRYIPVYRPEQHDAVTALLGSNSDFETNREQTANRLRDRLSRDGSAAHHWFALGLNLHDLGRHREAVEAYEQARHNGLSPGVIRYAPWIAAAYNKAGQPEAAYEVADALLADNPVSGYLLLERAQAAEALGDMDTAHADYQKAREYDPLLNVE